MCRPSRIRVVATSRFGRTEHIVCTEYIDALAGAYEIRTYMYSVLRTEQALCGIKKHCLTIGRASPCLLHHPQPALGKRGWVARPVRNKEVVENDTASRQGCLPGEAFFSLGSLRSRAGLGVGLQLSRRRGRGEGTGGWERARYGYASVASALHCQCPLPY